MMYNVEYLTLNRNPQVIQTHHSRLELLFWVHCFCTVVLFFSRVINKQVWATCLFEFLKYNLCGNLRTNLCGLFLLLFSVFMNIVSILIFGQYLTNADSILWFLMDFIKIKLFFIKITLFYRFPIFLKPIIWLSIPVRYKSFLLIHS